MSSSVPATTGGHSAREQAVLTRSTRSPPPSTCRAVGPIGEPLVDPVATYTRPDGTAVIGGFVYRGSLFPELVGKYVFGDFSEPTFTTGGRLFWIDTAADLSQIVAFRGDPVNGFLMGFGEDEDGENLRVDVTVTRPW